MVYGRMHACKRGYGAGAAQARLRPLPVVRAGARYKRPAWNRLSIMERKLDKVLDNQAAMQKEQAAMQKDQAEMKKDQAAMQKDQAEMKKDQAAMQKGITQLTMDTAVNKALVAVNLTPAASLVLGVLYFVYNNF
jgi:hypothetical protein